MKREDIGYFYETDRKRVYRLEIPKTGYETKLKIPGKKRITSEELQEAGNLLYSIYMAEQELSGEPIEEQAADVLFGAKYTLKLMGDSEIGRKYVSIVKEYELT